MTCGSMPHVERNWTVKLGYDNLSLELLGRQRPLMNGYHHSLLLILEIALPAVSGIESVAMTICAVRVLSLRDLLPKLSVASICFLQFGNLLVNFVLCTFLYLRLEMLKTQGFPVITDHESAGSNCWGKHGPSMMWLGMSVRKVLVSVVKLIKAGTFAE